MRWRLRLSNKSIKGTIIEYNCNDGHDPQLQVLIKANLGLEREVRHSVVQILNTILADAVILITKTRSVQRNLRGADFFEMRRLLEMQPQLQNHICDEIAERTQMLGSFTIGSLEEFIQHTRLDNQPVQGSDILHLLADHETCVRFLREYSRKCTG